MLIAHINIYLRKLILVHVGQFRMHTDYIY